MKNPFKGVLALAMSMLNGAKEGFGNIVYGAVGLVVFIILISAVVMPVVMGANQVGWTPATIAMWGIIPIVVIASVILFVIGKR